VIANLDLIGVFEHVAGQERIEGALSRRQRLVRQISFRLHRGWRSGIEVRTHHASVG